jgi:hypothetical protein
MFRNDRCPTQRYPANPDGSGKIGHSVFAKAVGSRPATGGLDAGENIAINRKQVESIRPSGDF